MTTSKTTYEHNILYLVVGFILIGSIPVKTKGSSPVKHWFESMVSLHRYVQQKVSFFHKK